MPFSVPDAWVINLDRNVERLEAIAKQMDPRLRWTRFPAVNGRTIDRNAPSVREILAPDLNYSPGAVGCAISHVQLWKLCVKLGTPLTIIEDDMVFAGAFFDQHAEFLQTIEADYDIVMWSSVLETFLWVEMFDGFGGATICYSREMAKSSASGIASTSPRRQIFKLLHQFGTGCYTISPSGAATLLTRMLPLNSERITFAEEFAIVTENEGIDCAMCAHFPSMKAYTCVPPLAISDGSTSTTKVIP